MEMEARVSMSRPVTPMAIKASTKLEPDTPRRSALLVDVVLQTIACDVSGERAIAIERSGLPVQGHRHHPHVIAVAGPQRGWTDGYGAVVHDASDDVGGVGIVGRGKGGLDEPRVVDLIPV